MNLQPSSPQRRHFTPEEKVTILRRHLLDKVPISNLCDEYGITPSHFYSWQKIAFENLGTVFAGNGRHDKRVEAGKDEKIAALEAKIQRKDGVLAELMEEHVALKKSLGET